MSYPPKCWGPPTMGIAPKLRVDARIRTKALDQRNEITARHIPSRGTGFEKYPFPRNLRRSLERSQWKFPKLPTLPKPFSFTEREQKKVTVNPGRGRRTLSLPAPKKLGHGRTVPKPFTFVTAGRSNRYNEGLKAKKIEQDRKRMEASRFHGNPVPLTHYVQPLMLIPTVKPLVQPVQVHLITQSRTQERNNYNKELKERTILKEMKNSQDEARTAEQEKMEDLKIRQGLCFKANPVPNYRFMEIKASTRPLTVPVSPVFSALPSHRRQPKL